MKVGEEGLYRNAEEDLVYINPIKKCDGHLGRGYTIYASIKVLKNKLGELHLSGQPSDSVLWYPRTYTLVARMSLEKAKRLVEYL